MYSSQKYMCSFARTLWLTIFTYGQTFGVFVRILSDDRPLYLSLPNRDWKQITRIKIGMFRISIHVVYGGPIGRAMRR